MPPSAMAYSALHKSGSNVHVGVSSRPALSCPLRRCPPLKGRNLCVRWSAQPCANEGISAFDLRAEVFCINLPANKSQEESFSKSMSVFFHRLTVPFAVLLVINPTALQIRSSVRDRSVGRVHFCARQYSLWHHLQCGASSAE